MIKNVLIVDDDQEMLVALENGFKKYSDTFLVVTAEDGRKAIDILRKKTISLVVTDLKMPGLDGFGLLQHIMQQFPEIPVVVITGYSTPKMEKLAREGGAVGYIAKPFMLDRLARKIMSTLRKESDGGTLHSVSSGIFLQLIEMEQKTCTIRLNDKESGQEGILFFKDGELLDARVSDLQGKPAAYKLFSWNKVSISIQNLCPPIENIIQSDLQPLILEAMRLKDETATEIEPSVQQAAAEPAVHPVAAADPIDEIKKLLEDRIGSFYGLEDIYSDHSWDGLLQQMIEVGDFFNTGALRLCFLDKGETHDYFMLPGKKTTVMMMNPKCPRDKIIQVLSREKE